MKNMYVEVDFDVYHIKQLTPYLDDITYIHRNNVKEAPKIINLKMRGFAWYYVHNGHNKSDAYRRAFFGKYNKETGKIEFDKKIQEEHDKKKGYSWTSKMSFLSGELYAKPYILEAIKRIQDHLIRNIKFDLPQSIIEQLTIQSTYDPSMFIDIEGRPTIKSLKDIPEKYRCCIEGIETRYYGRDASKKVIILKLVDRDKARKHLLGMIPSHLLEPEKKIFIHKTVDANNNEIGFDLSKLSDQELIEKYKELEDQNNG